jgi:hypothetical protein
MCLNNKKQHHKNYKLVEWETPDKIYDCIERLLPESNEITVGILPNFSNWIDNSYILATDLHSENEGSNNLVSFSTV